jgi:hypothetical protein
VKDLITWANKNLHSIYSNNYRKSLSSYLITTMIMGDKLTKGRDKQKKQKVNFLNQDQKCCNYYCNVLAGLWVLNIFPRCYNTE